MSKEITKSELEKQVKELKEANKILLEEKKYLAEAVEAKDKEIVSLTKSKDVEIRKLQEQLADKEKNSAEAKESQDKALKEFKQNAQVAGAFADRRTRELEKLLNLFNKQNEMLQDALDVCGDLKNNLLKEIQQ